MKGPCIAATAFAMGLAIASGSMNATAASRDEPAGGVAAQFGMAVTTVLDRFKAGYASRSPVFPALAPAKDFSDSSSPLATGAGARDPLAMMMASLGLMTVIAFRRRILYCESSNPCARLGRSDDGPAYRTLSRRGTGGANEAQAGHDQQSQHAAGEVGQPVIQAGLPPG